MDLRRITALEAGRLLRERKIGCAELTGHALAQIQAREPSVHAYITVLEEQAIRQAERVQARLDAGEALSPLAGVPMALKDNICTAGTQTSCGSKMLAGFCPPYSATAWERLEAAGAVLLGKTNLDEFAMGGSTETSYFGATHNPWNPERVPGGSSGGSAAAVAAGEAYYALGSDTGGSIRQPCSFCGVSGIKPTYGAVSRYGLVAYASSLDQIGPIGRTIEDCAAALSLIAGKDNRDSTSVEHAPDFSGSFSGDVCGLRVGLPKNCFGGGLGPDVAAPVLEAAKTLERLGAAVRECELPLADFAVPAYYIIACAEASSNLSRYDGIRYGYRSADAKGLLDAYVRSRSEGFGMEAKRRIMLGSFVLSSGCFDAYYKKGMQARRLIRDGFMGLLKEHDMLLMPAAPTTAYKLGENISDPLKMYLGDIYTVSVNLAGLPAAALPCGFGGGLPVGVQLVGRPFEEPLLVRAAHAFQLETDFHKQAPPIAAAQEVTQG